MQTRKKECNKDHYHRMFVFINVFLFLVVWSGSWAPVANMGYAYPIGITSCFQYNSNVVGGPTNVGSYGYCNWYAAGQERVRWVSTGYIQGDKTTALAKITGNDLDVKLAGDEQLPLSPSAFSASAERINFDDLSPDTPLDHQLTLKGILLLSADGNPMQIVDEAGMGGNDHPISEPYAAATIVSDAPMEIQFLSPHSKVGFYILLDHIESHAIPILRAFDAGNSLAGEASMAIPERSLRDSHAYFIGISNEQKNIHRVTFEFSGLSAAKIIDDLVLEPSQENNVSDAVANQAAILKDQDVTTAEKLDTINALQVLPSSQASAVLQNIARNDPDLYIRERAIMALTQVRDPKAIQTLVDIGTNPPSKELRIAARNAVWSLRKLFPILDPPSITMEVLAPLQIGEPFDVRATIVSPVDRNYSQIRFAVGKLLRQVGAGGYANHKGPLVAGDPVVLHGRFIADEAGFTSLSVFATVVMNPVDTSKYRQRLYIHIEQDDGTVSTEPFPDASIDSIHLPID